MTFNDWKEVELSRVVSSISNTHKLNTPLIIPINTSDVLEGHVLNHTYVQNIKLRGQFKKSFQLNDILFSEIRPENRRYALVDFNSKDYVASTKLMVLRRNTEEINTNFLYHVLTSADIIHKLQVIAESRSGTFPQITYNELSKLRILLPPLSEQKAIAHILSVIDAKVNLNSEIIKNLEEQAQLLFKRWFVDFEFPNEDGLPFKTNGGEIIQIDQGEIPIGWTIGNLGEIIELFDSKRIPLSSRERLGMDKVFPYYGAASMVDYVDNYIFDGTYVLLGEDGTVVTDKGFPVLQYVSDKFWVNNHAHVLKARPPFSDDSLYVLLSQLNVAGIVTGAVQQKINQRNLIELLVLIPEARVISLYNTIIAPFFQHILFLKNQSANLYSIKNALLPKLMSGEISVPFTEE